jgi:hypothetical protein
LILGLSPQSVKAALSRKSDRPSLAAAPEVARLFGGGKAPVKLLYVDAAAVFQGMYSWAQTMIQLQMQQSSGPGPLFDLAALPSAGSIGSHLRPTVAAAWRTPSGIEVLHQQTRPAAGGVGLPVAASWFIPRLASSPRFNPQARSTNNLKQIGLALHNYHAMHNRFPPAYSVDNEDKPLLSWRVYILPYVEQAQLYQQFHLDEPWDSKHNKKLLPQIPPVYRSRGSRAAPEKTSYLAVRGPRTIFPGKDPVSIDQITDGTSNTIMVVQTPDALAVEWTRPDDFVPDAKDPAKRLLDSTKSVLSLFADGSVHYLSAKIDADTLRALFDRADGRAVNAGRWHVRGP